MATAQKLVPDRCNVDINSLRKAERDNFIYIYGRVFEPNATTPSDGETTLIAVDMSPTGNCQLMSVNNFEGYPFSYVANDEQLRAIFNKIAYKNILLLDVREEIRDKLKELLGKYWKLKLIMEKSYLSTSGTPMYIILLHLYA